MRTSESKERRVVPRLAGAHAHNRFEAELDELTNVLRGYGVLTYDNLKVLSRSDHWCGPTFDAVLHEAVAAGRIRKLGAELYELDEDHPR